MYKEGQIIQFDTNSGQVYVSFGEKEKWWFHPDDFEEVQGVVDKNDNHNHNNPRLLPLPAISPLDSTVNRNNKNAMQNSVNNNRNMINPFSTPNVSLPSAITTETISVNKNVSKQKQQSLPSIQENNHNKNRISSSVPLQPASFSNISNNRKNETEQEQKLQEPAKSLSLTRERNTTHIHRRTVSKIRSKRNRHQIRINDKKDTNNDNKPPQPPSATISPQNNSNHNQFNTISNSNVMISAKVEQNRNNENMEMSTNHNVPPRPPLPPSSNNNNSNRSSNGSISTPSINRSSIRRSPISSPQSRPRKRKRNMMKNCHCDYISLSDDDETEYESDDIFEQRQPRIKKRKFEFYELSNHSDATQILHWFHHIGFGKYVNILRPQFEEIEMNGRGLKMIDVNDLKDFGIINFCDRKDILAKIKKLIYI